MEGCQTVVNNVGGRLLEAAWGRPWVPGGRPAVARRAGRCVLPVRRGGTATRLSLADAGLLDPRFFDYYEDTDLAWRGRGTLGWRHRYVPMSVVRHVHAASSIEGSSPTGTSRSGIDC